MAISLIFDKSLRENSFSRLRIQTKNRIDCYPSNFCKGKIDKLHQKIGDWKDTMHIYSIIVGRAAFGWNGKFTSNRYWKILYRIVGHEKERSSRRRITNDDILQPIIAYVEIRDLQHNGRRATRISASPLLWVLLVVPPPLTAVPVSGNVRFRQSIERIWERRFRWINYALSQFSKFVIAHIIAEKWIAGHAGELKWRRIVYRNPQFSNSTIISLFLSSLLFIFNFISLLFI